MKGHRYIENPNRDQQQIEKLKDEFWDWWYNQFAQSAWQPSIFEWVGLKLEENDNGLRGVLKVKIEKIDHLLGEIDELKVISKDDDMTMEIMLGEIEDLEDQLKAYIIINSNLTKKMNQL